LLHKEGESSCGYKFLFLLEALRERERERERERVKWRNWGVLQLSCCCRRIIKWGTVEVLLLRSLEEFRLELVWLVAGCGRV
jgi:hypothetical protein